jgi:hypothetical protein
MMARDTEGENLISVDLEHAEQANGGSRAARSRK